MHPDFPAYQRLQQQIKALADRWVRAWPEYGYRGGASNVRLSEAYANGAHAFGEKILFYAPYVDGIGCEGSMSSKYLDDDSTLEADSLAEYNAKRAAQCAKSDQISTLRATPEVSKYLELTQNTWGYYNAIYPQLPIIFR